jgi:hypothetical protein
MPIAMCLKMIEPHYFLLLLNRPMFTIIGFLIDTMFITNKGEPIKIAYDRARLKRNTTLTPQAMKAKGKMDIEDGELLADYLVKTC